VVQREEREAKRCNKIQPIELGSDSGDETKITTFGLSGKIGDDFHSRSKLFHIRVIMKHTKIDTLIDNGSQSNLISEEVVKKLGLNTKMHHKPYSLNWISKDDKFPIKKKCIIKFSITSKYVDALICDVVPLETFEVEALVYMIAKKSFTRNIINITCLKRELNMLYMLIVLKQINLF
jgi:hypothetical protein